MRTLCWLLTFCSLSALTGCSQRANDLPAQQPTAQATTEKDEDDAVRSGLAEDSAQASQDSVDASPSPSASADASPAAPSSAESPGLAVGESAPDFELPDQNGQRRSLSDLLQEGAVALVFYRSADW